MCGSSEITMHLSNRLELIGIKISDIDYMVTDCGSDVQKVARDTNNFSFPCLCHIINLIVKRLIVNEYDTTDDSDAEIDEADDTNISTSFKYVIAKVRYVVKEVTSKPTLAEQFL